MEEFQSLSERTRELRKHKSEFRGKLSQRLVETGQNINNIEFQKKVEKEIKGVSIL